MSDPTLRMNTTPIATPEDFTREEVELGRLALLLVAVGLCLAIVTVHGSIRAAERDAIDAPFPTIEHVAGTR